MMKEENYGRKKKKCGGWKKNSGRKKERIDEVKKFNLTVNENN